MINKKMIFVYNADDGKINALIDSIHKVVSPSTYSCNLCAITHGIFGMKSEWRKFINDSQYTIEFLHRNEFKEKYTTYQGRLPIIQILNNDTVMATLSPEEINACTNSEDLQFLIKKNI